MLHDILDNRTRPCLSSDPRAPGRRAENGHHDIIGLFKFPFMSFGLRNAAQTFQRFMGEILRGFDFSFT
jgi:hypothetical protein